MSSFDLTTTVIVATLIVVVASYIVVTRKSSKNSSSKKDAAESIKKPAVKVQKIDLTAKSTPSSSNKSATPGATPDASDVPDDALVYRHLRGHQSAILDIAIGPGGRHIASVSDDSQLRLWTVVDSEPNTAFARHNLKKGEFGTAVAMSGDGTYVVVAIDQASNAIAPRTIQIFGNKETKGQAFLTPLHSFVTPHKSTITTVLMSPNSQCIVTLSAGLDLNVHVFTIRGVLIQTLPIAQILNFSASISDDSRYLIVGAKMSETKVFELLYQKDSKLASFSPSAACAAAILAPQKVELALTLKGSKRAVHAVGFGSADSGLVVSGAIDGGICEHILSSSSRDAKLRNRIDTGLSSIDHIDVCVTSASSSSSSRGSKDKVTPVIAVSCGPSLQFYKASSGTSPAELITSIPHAHRGDISALKMSRTGRAILATVGNKTITLWRVPGQ